MFQQQDVAARGAVHLRKSAHARVCIEGSVQSIRGSVQALCLEGAVAAATAACTMLRAPRSCPRLCTRPRPSPYLLWLQGRADDARGQAARLKLRGQARARVVCVCAYLCVHCVRVCAGACTPTCLPLLCHPRAALPHRVSPAPPSAPAPPSPPLGPCAWAPCRRPAPIAAPAPAAQGTAPAPARVGAGHAGQGCVLRVCEALRGGGGGAAWSGGAGSSTRQLHA